ncbi:MAG: hypothetical protein ACREQ1_07905, partial [Woeseiaceae bacterium]
HVGSRMLTQEDENIAGPMRLAVPQQVALHSYVFEVGKEGALFDYAAITELHHPLYLTEADLQSIYGRSSGGTVSRA